MDNIYRINPYTQTDKGLSRAELLVIFLDQDASFQELGEKTLYALHKPKHIVPHLMNKEDTESRLHEWYKLMKIKSWQQVVKNGKSITVYISDGQIHLSSSKPDGRGFGPSGKPERTCPDVDPEALGQAIIDTFNDCE